MNFMNSSVDRKSERQKQKWLWTMRFYLEDKNMDKIRSDVQQGDKVRKAR